jgi:type II secretory pathway pseudopilin PulG
MPCFKKSLSGYTLIELSIVIGLIGLLMGTALSIGNRSVEQKSLKQIESSTDTIEQAIKSFYYKYNRIPCPASPSQAEQTAGFGIEDNCSATLPTLANIVELNNGTADEQWVGVVPVRTLGLPDRMMYDKWNNRITYVVQKNFADKSQIFGNQVVATTATMLKIRDASGNKINPDDLENPVVYILINHGKDKRGAYNSAGVLFVSCAASNTQIDVENCDATDGSNKDDIFIDREIADSTILSQYYYDIIRWKTKNNFGPSSTDPLVPVLAKQVNVSSNTCIITPANTLKCTGTTSDPTHFVQEPNAFTDWSYLDDDCALRSNGRAYCWGSDITTIAELAGNYTDWSDISSSTGGNKCGVRAGSAYCWGDNTYGQFGNNTSGTSSTTPVQVLDTAGVTPYTDWVDIEVGYRSTCGRRTNGITYCWGDNSVGQVGASLAIPSTQLTPLPVSGGFTNWSGVSAAGFGGGACGMRSNGRAYCWGWGIGGQLGSGTNVNAAAPREIQMSAGITTSDWKIVRYGWTSCGIRGSGIAYCWGVNDQGQGGTGIPSGTTASGVMYPQQIGGGFTDWIYLDPPKYGYTGCGIRSNYALYCWGANDTGQFGNGKTSAEVVGPTQIFE